MAKIAAQLSTYMPATPTSDAAPLARQAPGRTGVGERERRQQHQRDTGADRVEGQPFCRRHPPQCHGTAKFVDKLEAEKHQEQRKRLSGAELLCPAEQVGAFDP